MRRSLLIAAPLVTTFFLGPVLAEDQESPPGVAEDFDRLQPDAQRLIAALRHHDVEGTIYRIEGLRALRRSLQIRNLTTVAAAFIVAFKQERDAFEPEDSLNIARAAIALAPDFPSLYFNLAETIILRQPGKIGQAIRAFLAGISAYKRYPRGLFVLLGRLSNRLVFTVLASFVLIAFFMTLRHLRKVVHDIGDLFPPGPSTAFSGYEIARSRSLKFIVENNLNAILATSVTLIALVFPLVAGGGAILSSLLWLTVVVAYTSTREMVVAWLSTLMVPFALLCASLIYLPIQAERGSGAVAWRCLKETCDAEDLSLLTQKARAPSGFEALAIGVANFRTAMVSSRPTEAHLSFLDEISGVPEPILRVFEGNMALIVAASSCSEGRPEEQALNRAKRAFEAALRVNPSDPPALFGLAIAAGLGGDRASAERAMENLIKITPEEEVSEVAALRTMLASRAECGQVFRLLAFLRPPDIPDLRCYLSQTNLLSGIPAIPASSFFLGSTSPFTCLVVVLVFLALLPILRKLRSRRAAYECPMCGNVTCPSCNTRASDFDYCPVCLLEQVRPRFVDPKDLLAKKERRGAAVRLRRKLALFLGLLVPGSGQVLAGRPFKGGVLLVLLSLAISMVTRPVPIHLDPVGFTGVPGQALPALPPILLAVIYFLSALDLWLQRRR